MYQAQEKSAVNSMNKILQYLCYENTKLTSYLLNTCALIINDKQCQEFFYSFTCARKILAIDDSLAEGRVEHFLERMIQSIEAN